ncbi:MAG: phosphoserine phosphatase RsbU/P [Blastocatellia bacterium]|nr:phosphoserine phosphatase RsbU/P [Blastocatellia bacterium]
MKATVAGRAWLGRVMPLVAGVAAVLFVLRMLLGGTRLYGDNFAGGALKSLTVAFVCAALVYYGLRGLLWIKRRLLWRVRRRLVITYLFVGLTPIVLFLLLGLLSAFGGSNQAMSRIVAAQFNATERQAREQARALSEAFARLPANTDARSLQAWLDERAAQLQVSLPGTRLALWRAASDNDATALGHSGFAAFASELKDEGSRGVGSDTTPAGAPLPEWLRERAEWTGLAYMPNADARETFSSPSIRSMMRGAAGNRAFTLLLVVPISRALIQQYRDATGINVRPFFLNAALNRSGERLVELVSDDEERRPATAEQQQERARESELRIQRAFRQDQLGEPIGNNFYVVVLSSTNWLSGEPRPSLAFLFDWSWAVAGKQFLGGGEPGALWWQLFKYVSLIFLVLELLALFAAVWMTRAVTGTVHRLYRATEFIKQGDFSHRVRVRSRDQLGELAESFNDMSSNIESLLHERVERERLEREVEIAAEVQAQLFPRSAPQLKTISIAAECRAARGVAGDYYDYIEVTPGLVALALGDVAGKGISASLVMSNLQASLRAQTTITAERLHIARRAMSVSVGGASTSTSNSLLAHVVADAEIDGALARITTNINRQLCQSTEANRFATLFLALYEDETRSLRYTNAGHNAPLLVRADGRIEELSAGGLMVGAFDWAEYEEGATELRPGDALLIYSDGITEAERATGEEYGVVRLMQLAVSQRHLAADELRQAVFDAIDDWTGSQERNDDQTLVIVKTKD